MATTLKLKFLGGTALARHYQKPGAPGNAQWVPRSVCPKTLKFGDKVGDLHEVTVEDWWLEKNPFDRPTPKGQGSLF